MESEASIAKSKLYFAASLALVSDRNLSLSNNASDSNPSIEFFISLTLLLIIPMLNFIFVGSRGRGYSPREGGEESTPCFNRRRINEPAIVFVVNREGFLQQGHFFCLTSAYLCMPPSQPVALAPHGTSPSRKGGVIDLAPDIDMNGINYSL
jgi:hypothetical protein